MTEEIYHQMLGPEQLHMRIPVTRRTRVGLGRQMPPIQIPPFSLHWDLEAIETKRKVFEDIKMKRWEDKDMEPDGTRSKRRAAEVELLGKLPTDLYVNHVIPTARNLDWTRLKGGIFLSAGETSYDWNDSYDQLDISRPGYIAVELYMIKFSKIVPEGAEVGEAEEAEEDTVMPDLEEEINRVMMCKAASSSSIKRNSHTLLQPPSPVQPPPHSPIRSTKAAGHTIHIPVDVSRDHSAFTKYRLKYKDQYGVGYHNWPQFKGTARGKGYEVAYDPLDVAALPDRQQARHQSAEVLVDENGLFELPAPEGTSIRLLREAVNEPYRPPRSGDPPDDDEESDDEGDLFRHSYLESSRVSSGNDEV